jgi:hypothetical protein
MSRIEATLLKTVEAEIAQDWCYYNFSALGRLTKLDREREGDRNTDLIARATVEVG